MDTAVASTASGPAALLYRVGGMDCPSCASKIETALKRMGGAEGILVNYHSQTLALWLDEATRPRTAVETQIRSLGYDVRPLEFPSSLSIADAAGVETASDVAPGGDPWWLRHR
jgi:Cd2+/Zn2+-exporting ATPase